MDNELAFYTQVCINRILFPNYFTDELVRFALAPLLSPTDGNESGRANLPLSAVREASGFDGPF